MRSNNFSHSAWWPLTGRHRSASCNACHSGGQYSGTPTECYDCHQDDFEDEHSGGTPHDCTQCHSTSNWDADDGRATHDSFFPIFSGRHRNLWYSCEDCHPQGKNYSLYSCFGCHDSHKIPGARKKGLRPMSKGFTSFKIDGRDCLACHS